MKSNKTNQQATDFTIPIVEFGFNEEWEANNWYETIYSKARYGLRSGSDKWNLGGIPADLPSALEGIRDHDEALAFIKKRLKKARKKLGVAQLIELSIQKARKRWQQVDRDFFPILSAMLDVPVSRFEPCYHAYFTLSTRAPFGKNAFMFNHFLDFADLAMHEIMHIEFLKAYAGYCQERGLDGERVEHLKEILTVLLNEDAIHLLSRPDPGYAKHASIRPKALEFYREGGGKEGHFKTFLDRVIEPVRRSSF